jgi:hypothetical protein
MHGTFVNQKKIPAGHDVTIRNGDILMFGNEVTRGSETFPPLEVRCQFEWFDISKAPPVPGPEKQASNQTTNSFAVPDDDDDDDDDVVEIVPESTPPKLAPHPQFVILDSDTDSDSDDSRLLDHQSPGTSPLVKDMDANNTEEQPQTPHGVDRPKTDANMHLNPSDGNRQTPELPNDRLQSSPSNPPGAYPEAEDKCYSQAADSESDSELMQASPAEEVTDLESDNWDMEHISPDSYLSDELGDDDSLNENYSVTSSLRSVSPSYKVRYAVSEHSSDGCLQSNGWESGRQSFDNTSPSQLSKSAVHQQSETAPVAANNSAPGSQALSQTPTDNSPQANTRLGEMNYDPVQYQDNWPADSSPPRVPSPSDKAMAKTSNPPVPSYSYSTFPPSFDEWPVPQASSHPPQVPFSPYQPPALVNSLHSYANYLPQSFPLPQSRSSLRNPLGGSSGFVEQFSDERLNDYRTKPIGNCNAFGQQVPPTFVQTCNPHPVNASAFAKPPLDQGNNREKPTLSSVTTTTTTRVSIADIVDESGSEVHCPDVKRPPKRKAADTELEPPLSETDDPGEPQSFSDCPVSFSPCHIENDNKDIIPSLPDAQLQPTAKDLAPDSQLAETSTLLHSEPVQPVDTDTRKPEPRRKRIKVRNGGQGGTFARYAATALVGAVVGGITTVAALASLPPDFFAPGAF